jgi:hypothetical protein
MVIVGLLGLAFKYQDFSPRLAHGVGGQPLLLPLLVLIPMIAGLIYQQTHSAAGAAGAAGGDGGGDAKRK